MKQVRDVAYSVEDSLVDLAIQAERERRRTPRCLGCVVVVPRAPNPVELKELKVKVLDVSSRNKLYRLIKDGGAAGGSKPAGSFAAAEPGGIAAAATAALFGMDRDEKAKAELLQLVISAELELRVIAV